jgi:hypothetical protein
VRGLPQRIGPTRSLVAAAALLAGAATCLTVLTRASALTLSAAVTSVAVLVGVAVTAGRSPSRRLAFRALILAVGLLIAAFVVDGADRLTG